MFDMEIKLFFWGLSCTFSFQVKNQKLWCIVVESAIHQTTSSGRESQQAKFVLKS